MIIRRLTPLALLVFASPGLAAPPVLAHCGGCGTGGSSHGVHKHSAKKAKLGAPAPDFTLTDLAGKKHDLSNYKGKTVVLEWFNPGCPFVVAAHEKDGVLQTMAKEYAAKGVVWLAVNSSAVGRQGHGKATNSKAAKKWKMDHPILVDEKGSVGKAYGAKTTPHMFVVNKAGKLVYKGAPDNAPYGNPSGSLEPYLANALADVAAGKKVRKSSTKAWGCSVKYAR